MTDWLLNAEYELEDFGVRQGEVRFLKASEKAFEDAELIGINPAVAVLEQAFDKAKKALQDYIDAGPNGAIGDRKLVYDIISKLDVDALVLSGLYRCYNVAISGQRNVLYRCLNQIAIDVNKELWAYSIANDNPKLYKLILKDAKAHPQGRKAYKRATKIAAEYGYVGEDIPNDLAVKIAGPIFDAVFQSDLFSLDKDRSDGPLKITFRFDVREALALVQADSLKWARPVFYPMLVLPERWKAINDGGYLSEAVKKAAPIISFRGDRAHKGIIAKAFQRGELDKVSDSLDVLQGVSYRINTTVLEAVEHAATHGWKCAKLPENSAPELPEVPEDIKEWPEAKRKEFWRGYYETKELQSEVLGTGLVYSQTLDTARMLSGYERFYQPYFLDKRGRVYPRASFNHTRQDYVRGMIEFADGKPLGDDGQKWLEIHLANCASGDKYGKLDKISFQARREWVSGNVPLLRRISQDWRNCPNLWALSCDTPFQFLAAANAFCQSLDVLNGNSTTGRDSRLFHGICALDGTNSGLQHYSAALRSAKEGQLVNLIASDSPEDVYEAVATIVREFVSGDIDSLDNATASLARAWLDIGISRSTVKRQVMTFVYGSSTFGFTRQIMTDLMRPLQREVALGRVSEHPFGDGKGAAAAASYMAKKVYEAIAVVAPGARAGMDWIRNEAKVLAKAGKHMYWRNPLGMPVVHRYLEQDTQRVNLFLQQGGLDKRRISLDIPRQTTRLMKHRQVSASAPNVIHSMDAAHLKITALSASRSGITHLATIHDSFGTHFGQTEELSKVLRSAFVDMYEDYDVFHEIRRQTLKVVVEPDLIEMLMPLPNKGELELANVLQSPYFFS